MIALILAGDKGGGEKKNLGFKIPYQEKVRVQV
jgi:hypothetical protein